MRPAPSVRSHCHGHRRRWLHCPPSPTHMAGALCMCGREPRAISVPPRGPPLSSAGPWGHRPEGQGSVRLGQQMACILGTLRVGEAGCSGLPAGATPAEARSGQGRAPRPAASSQQPAAQSSAATPPAPGPSLPSSSSRGVGGRGFNVARTFPMTDSSARDAALLHLEIMRYPETRISSA